LKEHIQLDEKMRDAIAQLISESDRSVAQQDKDAWNACYQRVTEGAQQRSGEQPTIQQQHSEGANSPNVVGSGNVFNYSAEPDVRSLPAGFVERLSRFAGQRFWIMAQTNDYDEMSEQVRFARAIGSALETARWVKAPEVSPQPGRLYTRVSDRGVIVYVAQSALEAGAALRDGLRSSFNKVELAHDVNLKDGIVVMVGLQ
jgi:hypothetical protein